MPVLWDRKGEVECPYGVVIVSQTCDAVRDTVAEVQVSPITRLGAGNAGEARTGRRPRYAALAGLGDDFFADLSVIATIHKKWLLGQTSKPGLVPDESQADTKFSRAVGRRFDRFAFPDEVTPWLKPLQDLMRSKAPKAGPIAELTNDIVELRLEAIDGWGGEPPYALVLIVVVRVGAIPEIDPDAEAADLDGGVGNQTLGQVAANRPIDGAPAKDVVEFWDRVSAALERLCRPHKDAPAQVRNAVASLEVEIVSEDDLTYSRVRRSVEVDLDHLSSPGYLAD